MYDVFQLGYGLLNAAVALPAAVVIVELAAAFPKSKAASAAPPGRRPTVAVLVPAHDECETIEATVGRLLTQLREDDRVVVVADNCTDTTAALARAAGAEVIERFDASRRGKGYALDFGARHLEANPPEVVIVVDADVSPAAGALDRLAERVAASGRPQQAVYLLRQTDTAPANPVSLLAFAVRNCARPLGLSRLGGPCPLFGAGMAFPWPVFRDAPLGSPHLTEDVALALDLAKAGHLPQLAPDALIEGDCAPSEAAAARQRRRWEHGHLSLVCGAAPRLLLNGLLKFRPASVALALDVMVPPLSLLVMIVTAAVILNWLAAFAGWTGITWAVVQTATLLGLMTTVAAAAVRFGPDGPPDGLLLQFARYAVGKVPLYAGFLFNRQKSWDRTDRSARQTAEEARGRRAA